MISSRLWKSLGRSISQSREIQSPTRMQFIQVKSKDLITQPLIFLRKSQIDSQLNSLCNLWNLTPHKYPFISVIQLLILNISRASVQMEDGSCLTFNKVPSRSNWELIDKGCYLILDIITSIKKNLMFLNQTKLLSHSQYFVQIHQYITNLTVTFNCSLISYPAGNFN